MPPEGVAGGDVGLDAWLIGGSSRDVVGVMGASGKVLFDRRRDDVGTLRHEASAIRERGQAILRRLAGRR
jgi:hypothetical protein